MNIKRLISRILPPIIYDAARKRRNVSPAYRSSDDASVAARSAGYNDPDISQATAYNTKLAYDRLMVPVPTLAASEIKTVWAASHAVEHGSLVVHDFGGACGGHYFAVRAGLPDDVAIFWVVIETPGMASAGREFVASLDERTRNELVFATTWAEARGLGADPDLVHSSSAIFCMPDPIASLREHMASGARYLFITRIGLAGNGPLYAVQRRLLSKGTPILPPGMKDREVSYRLAFENRDRFEAVLAEQYDIIARPEEDNPTFTVGGVGVPGWGCLAKRKE